MPSDGSVKIDAELDSNKLKTEFGKLGDVAKKAAAGIAVAVGAAGAAVGAFLVSATNSAAQLEQNLGGAEAVFGEYADSIKQTASEAAASMGSTQSDYLATANKMGSLFQGAGFDTQESMKLTSETMQRAADVASVMGIDTAAAMESIAGAAKGNFTMMDNLGVAMNETTLQAYAEAQGIDKATSAMTNQEKIGLAMQMFLEKTAKYEGNFAKESRTMAGALSILSAEWGNFKDDVGSAVLPAASGIIQQISDTLSQVDLEPIKEALTSVVGSLADLVAKALPAILDAIPVVLNILTWIIDNGDIIVSILIGIGSGLLAFNVVTIIQGLVTAFSAWRTATEGMSVAQAILNAVMKANPIAIIISLIAAVVAAIVALWTTNEDFRNALITAWEAVKEFFSSTWEAIKGFFLGAWEAIKSAWGAVANWFKTKIIDPIANFFQSMGQTITNIWNGIINGIKGAINGIIGFINGMVRGITNGINAVIGLLNKLSFDIPEWVPFLGGKRFGFNIPLLSAPQIPMLAKGGILTSGSAIVGEKGRELLSVSGGRAQVTPLTGNAGARALSDAGMGSIGGFGVIIENFNNYDTREDMPKLFREVDQGVQKIFLQRSRGVT